MNSSSILCAVMTVAASALAQNVVSPFPFATLPAPSSNTHPIGPTLTTSPSMRYMGIHDDMIGKAGVVKGLGFRLNEGATSVATVITMEVRISTAASLASAASTTFDTNHGADKTTVVPTSTPFNFGVFTAPTPGPNPFVLQVPFNTFFTFAGAGGIAWEMLIASRTNTASFSLDAGSAAAFNIVGVTFGTGCLATGRTTAASASSAYASGNLTLSASNLTGTAPGSIVLGTSRTNWGPLPLPLLLPGTTGFPSGSCNVYSDWVVDLPGTSTAAGGLSQVLPLALGPTTLGVTVYHYGFSLDAAANALGLVTSSSRLTGFGDGTVLGGCRIYAVNNVGAVSGTKDSTIIVTEFQY